MKKILSAISAVALMFAGCTKDLTNDVVGSTGIERGALVEKTAIFADSRVERDGETGKLAWSEGDQVAAVLLNSDGTYALDTEVYTVIPETSKVCIPENTAYVIYPYAKRGSLSKTTLSLDLADTYTVASPEDIFDQTLMKGVVTGEVIEFNNLLGYAKLQLKGSSSVKSIVLKNQILRDFKAISRKATLDLSGNVSEGGGVKMATDNTGRAYLKIKFSTPLDLSTEPTIWFPIPENSYDKMALVVETAENGTYRQCLWMLTFQKLTKEMFTMSP